MPIMIASLKKKLMSGGHKISKMYCQNEKIYSAGNIVTYIVDSPEGKTYTEEIDSDASCLSPTTFTPHKEGWEFVGWREDVTATDDVLSEKIMNDNPVTLYAVYNKTITRTFHSMNGTTSKSEVISGTAYYNASGDTAKAEIVVPSGGTYTGWSWRGWSGINSTAADANVVSESGKTIYTLDDGNVYGLYQADVILTTVVNTTSTEYKKTKYYNSFGTSKTPKFTIEDPAPENYLFFGWSLQPSDNEVVYESITNMTLSKDMTVYAILQPNIITVYDATYNWPDVGFTSNPPKTTNINDTTYVSLASEVGYGIGGDVNDNNTYVTPEKILLVLAGASAAYKYVDVTFEYFNHADYGESESYIDGVLFNKHDGTNKVYTKTVTWEIAEKIKCSGHIRLVDKSSATTYWCDGFIGVKKVVLREWTGITSYLVNFADYPITKTESGIDGGAGQVGKVETSYSGYTMSVRKNPDANGHGFVKASVTLPTQGCNKVSITYMCFATSFMYMNGEALVYGFATVGDTYTFDCLGDTFTLNIDLSDATGDNTAILEIQKICFYKEEG